MLRPDLSTKLEPGLTIGPYQLGFRLGVGGMAEVWSARRPSGETVALKLLRSDLDPGDHQLFADEAKAALSLKHPNIVATYDYGFDHEREYYYIAMELIAGPSVSVLLQSCQKKSVTVPPEVVALIGVQIARALHHAHAEATLDGRLLRLVHRDVTPHNIMLEESGRAVLTDFGVARTDVQEHRTKTGTIRGKPAYMSPEQVCQEPVDQRTDIFSLGIVLYEIATMRRLFGRGNMIGSIKAVAELEPLPIPQIVPGFPEPLWLVIKAMLEKKAERRIPTPGDVAARLNALEAAVPGMQRATAMLGALVGWSFPKGSFEVERIFESTLSTTTAPDLAKKDGALEAALGADTEDDAMTEIDRPSARTRSWPVLDLSGDLELPPVAPLDLRDILDTQLPMTTLPQGRASSKAPIEPPAAERRGRAWMVIGVVGMGTIGAGVALKLSLTADAGIPQVTLATRPPPPPTQVKTTTVTSTSVESAADFLEPK